MQRRVHSNDEGWLLSYADLITNLLIFFAMLLAASQIDTVRMQQITQEISGVEQPASLASIQQEIEQKIEEKGLQALIQTQLGHDGLKVSLDSGLMFASGSAAILGEQREVLEQMLRTLVPYADRYAFAVEGHTDSRPVSAESYYKSNWELSTDRANAVRERLEAVGVAPERIRVEGYADTVALPPPVLEGLSPEDRLARHRRVIVRIF